jgi:hypothetical protein
MNQTPRYSRVEIDLKRLQVARDTGKGQRELALMKQGIDLASGQAQAAITAIDRHYDQLVASYKLAIISVRRKMYDPHIKLGILPMIKDY